jgi:hypothetical protein
MTLKFTCGGQIFDREGCYRSGKELEELPATGYRDPALSRDGALLAISSDDDHNGKDYIHIYDFARGTSTRVADGGAEVFPVLSPDGKRVAYVGNNAKTSQYIDVAATDGSANWSDSWRPTFSFPTTGRRTGVFSSNEYSRQFARTGFS